MTAMQPGLVGTASVRVNPGNTAASLGNEGVDVFATPFMVALVEEACRVAVEAHIPQVQITLGGLVELRHLAPTPLGFEVTARATLSEVKGAKLTFTVEVTDPVEVVGTARHVRFLASADDFFEAVDRKSKDNRPRARGGNEEAP